MRNRSLLLRGFLAVAILALAAQSQSPGIEITGSGIIGTPIDLTLRGPSGETYILYAGVLPGGVRSWSGQRLGVGQFYVPISAGQFGTSGEAKIQIPVPDLPQLVGFGMAYFQFETFKVRLFPPGLVPTNVSPGAYVIVAPKGSGGPTSFGVDNTDTKIGSTLTLRMRGTPGDFILGYWGVTALPIVLTPVQTVVGLIPVANFTSLLARFDGQGDYSTTFAIPDVPAAVGINGYFQYQTYAIVGFPPQFQLRDSSCCLFFTLKDK